MCITLRYCGCVISTVTVLLQTLLRPQAVCPPSGCSKERMHVDRDEGYKYLGFSSPPGPCLEVLRLQDPFRLSPESFEDEMRAYPTAQFWKDSMEYLIMNQHFSLTPHKY